MTSFKNELNFFNNDKKELRSRCYSEIFLVLDKFKGLDLKDKRFIISLIRHKLLEDRRK